MSKKKLEMSVLGVCAVLAVILAATTDYSPHLDVNINWLINLSSLLTVASFSVRGILPLRMLASASQAIAIPYFVLQPTPLWAPVGWTVLFLAINLYHITRSLLERRPVKFTDDERRLYELAFGNFEPGEFMRLLKVGKWESARQGDRICNEGDTVTRILVTINGAVAARQHGCKIGTLGPGELFGAGAALKTQSSPFAAEFEEDARYMCWSKADIDRFLHRNPDLSGKFDDVVNRYLVAQINKLALHVSGSAQNGDVQPART